ncbi:uncharacterized protein BDR25DRAFT_329674 [Lindgomyces ingoldianus]|uniref:Uncharacterized protein n=1 Tax=Lindgomyces ingoldianus TaxID=673940 RepID=A0ACB6Q979_9PLEO|nr:uncharacterized protein BDR25DRAFT_329674 [Lindgomyces ingoldianus]KAF2463440.1 hypothetical protein BDR25DRAFT_329674 [Lindgomyces ingoldianus]
MASTLYKISRLDLEELETPALASITDVKALSSYNWIEAPNSTPTIAVPGSPALWSSLGKALFEPLLRALYLTHPSFDIRSTDVVTDRNNIRKLFSFINPSSTRNGLEAFTISIEVTKNTAIFCWDETKTLEEIGPQESRGFGHEFEKAYTITQISGSTGHHRIISYRFSNLNCIVRHETDGYVDNDPRASSKAKNHTRDGLSSMLKTLSLSPTSGSPCDIPTASKLTIKEEGQIVPLESTLEIKTRVSHKYLDIEEVAPQLWISQTPKLVRAYHQNALIRKIINIVKECGGNAVLKYNVEGDKLVVCKVERKEMLPKDLYSKWDDRHHLGAETDAKNDGIQGPKIAQKRRESISATRTMRDDFKLTIKIGDVDYSVHVSKIPYWASFVRLQKVTHPESTEFIHEPINLFDVALRGVESGYRQCFRSLSTNLSQYRTLFDTYKFLDVDVLGSLSIDEVIANLKGGKSLARDTAFQLLYLILYAQFGDERRPLMKLFNAVMFVVSHPRTFKYRAKRMIRLAYEERFRVTTKQKARLDEWEKGESCQPCD